MPNGYYASGRGLVYYHDGWSRDRSFFGGHMPPLTHEDHDVHFCGDFQLYRKGEWVLTHPLGYRGPAIEAEGVNGMLIYGLSSMSETRGPVASETGDDFAYIAGSMSGQFYKPPYYNPPPTFLHEWTRSLVYLPSADRRSDTVIVFDRLHADDPRKLGRFDRYRADDRAKIASSPMCQWILHVPAAPRFTPGGFSWKTSRAQHVQVQTLFPDRVESTVHDERQLWAQSRRHFKPAELKFQVRLIPREASDWLTFLNVIQVDDNGKGIAGEAVQSDRAEAKGVVLRRPDRDDVLLLFGARKERRLLSAGYRVQWKSSKSGTKVLLFDLDAQKKWSVRIAGQNEARPLPVSTQGAARLAVQGGEGPKAGFEIMAR